jgi:glycosyltransferase involved in cell wall biosynthesis
MKRINVSVSNDLICDNRVNKTCKSLVDYGLSVKLIGRAFKHSPKLSSRSYECKRLPIIFRKNAIYYAELNLRLFFYLLFSKQDFLWANDLDTLLANYLVAKLKRKPLIFDSHEHFTQVPELKNNPFARKIWKAIEKHCIKGCDAVFTVCNPIKNYFKEEYNKESHVVRNIPSRIFVNEEKIPSENKENIIVWQGAVNIERGLEELCQAMQWIDAKLLIMGEGDIKSDLEKKVRELRLEEKIHFLGRLPFEKMIEKTKTAKLAISIDKPTNGNYAISLPNKIFEYIACSVPVLVSALQEIKFVVEKYETGIFISSYNPQDLAKQIDSLLKDNSKLDLIAENCRKAAKEFCWEKEETMIFETLKQLEKN